MNFNPKSIYVLKDTHIDDHMYNQNNVIGSFNTGIENYNHDYSEELMDRIRYFTEECDNLQGFQLLTDISNPVMGGLTSQFIQSLREEYNQSKYPIITLGIDNNINDDEIYQSNTFHITVRLNLLHYYFQYLLFFFFFLQFRIK